MSARARGFAPLLVAVAAGALLILLAPSAVVAETAPGLRAKAAALRGAEQGALLQLYAAESSLARARGEEARLASRSRALAAEERLASRRAHIVQRSLAASQSRVARILRDLYVEGDVDPVAVIFGAGSLDELVTGIESLGWAAEQNRSLARQARTRAAVLRGLRARLADRRRALDDASAAARAATTRLEQATARRAATVSSLRRQGALTAERLGVLQDQARAAQRASAELTATATEQEAPDPEGGSVAGSEPLPATAVSLPAGTSTLVVDAVAYHLPGRTASGLPVGIGVIAVDPLVIPLGTRVFVPGYGAAVAADTGTAIRGNIIDLWMPSTAQARAWGRRTVTITVYGS
ncbi:MAG: 3D domain-containing protein [Gaiellaceae bacterium]